jgi:hypothetical protein
MRSRSGTIRILGEPLERCDRELHDQPCPDGHTVGLAGREVLAILGSFIGVRE